eukprot:CAMPEP_0172171972 /NCGR_PEP_ID=MMETSP1050-20130122/12188_1 /TAXON_ID=233186 /ORGANISM="Cryptomonas curvata, Strain CCAP979/52" /LENGTH=434 /DNA_ID=CAMNT_0012843461 /DNA_START=54 /DNA_END=1358 /DNA_ORIENTATION=-
MISKNAFLFLILHSLSSEVLSRRSILKIENDRRTAFLVEPFCFAEGGYLDLQVQDFVLKSAGKEVQPTSVGFLVRHVDGSAYATANVGDMAVGHDCLLKTEPDDGVPHREYMVPLTPGASNFSLVIETAGAGMYAVLYANCDLGTAASFSLAVTLMNRGGVFLSAGDIPLPATYALLGASFLLAAGVWIAVVRAHRTTAHAIHALMAVLCLVKAAAVLLEAARLDAIRTTGEGHGWTPAYYVFAFVKGIMTFGVILLLGTGWSFIKPFLADRDKRILLVVLPLQVVVNTAMVVVEETPPGTMGWLTWRDVLHLFDVVCCCAVLFPIVWSIRHLREAAEADGKAARTLMKLKLFREFYVMLVAYIYFTRIVVYLLRATTPCAYSWVSKAVSELATLAFFVMSGYKFRPVEGNPYLKVDNEDDEGAAELREVNPEL